MIKISRRRRLPVKVATRKNKLPQPALLLEPGRYRRALCYQHNAKLAGRYSCENTRSGFRSQSHSCKRAKLPRLPGCVTAPASLPSMRTLQMRSTRLPMSRQCGQRGERVKRTGCIATRIYASCRTIGFPACALMWSDAHLLVTGHMRRWLDPPWFRFAKSSDGCERNQVGSVAVAAERIFLSDCFGAT